MFSRFLITNNKRTIFSVNNVAPQRINGFPTMYTVYILILLLIWMEKLVKLYLYLEQNIISIFIKLLIVLNILFTSLYSKSKFKLVHSSNTYFFNRLAHKHGLELIDRQTFKDYFDNNKDSREARNLLARMKALEVCIVCK